MSRHQNNNVESVSQPKFPYKNAKFRFKTTKNIIETIRSQPSKDDLNSHLFGLGIKNIIDRAYPPEPDSNGNTHTHQKISEMDCYYIPCTESEVVQDLLKDDNKIYKILRGLLCRPQFFWQSEKTGDRIITEEGLDRLNYILNMAAKHALRRIDKASLLRTNPSLNDEDKIPGCREPTSDTTKTGESRIGYNYFRDKLKDFTVSQRSDKDKKYKIYFNIQSKEQFCQLVRFLLVDYIPVVESGSQISASIYNEDYWSYRYDETTKERVRDTIIHPKEEIKMKPLSTRVKDGLFLKCISCFADIERCDGYAGRHTHYEQIKREIIEPLLQTYKIQNTQNNNSKKAKVLPHANRKEEQSDDHEKNESTDINIDYKKHKIRGKLILCTKSQNSIFDKTMRDVDYSAPTSLKDMIRGSFIMKDHHDVLFMLHYFIKYFIKNPEHNFDHNSSNNGGFDPERGILRGLQIKDKGIINTEIQELIKNLKKLPKGEKPKHDKNPYDFTNDELDWAATNFILNSIEKSSSKKSANSAEYIDIKVTAPTLMRPNPLDIEFKFLTEENYKNNESGLASHDVLRLKQDTKGISRGEHFILTDKVKQEIDLLLQRKPELKSQIEAKLIAENRGRDETDAAEKIYTDTTSTRNVTTVRGEYGEDGSFQSTLLCDKEIWEYLKDEGFNYSAKGFNYDDDDNAERTPPDL